MKHIFHANIAHFRKLCAKFSKIRTEAYKHTHLICNQFLSQNPITTDIYEKHQLRQDAPLQFNRIPRKILTYTFHSIYLYILYITGALFVRICYPMRQSHLQTKKVIFIENYFILHDIVDHGKYSEKYFNGLLEILIKRNIPYVFVPKLYGIEKPFTLLDTLNILKRTKINVLLEFHLFTIGDYIRILGFILTYPFRTLWFALGLGSKTFEERLIKQGLLDSLEEPVFLAFSRYLFGLRLGRLENANAKHISWFENQEIDKALIKGLRAGGSKARIFGCQLFIWAPTLFHIHIDNSDIASGLAPDKVLVSGEIYLRSSNDVNFQLGPSLRYAKLFSTKRDHTSSRHVIVLLSYYVDECREIISMLKDELFANETVYFRLHPSTSLAQLSSFLPSGYRTADGDLYSWLKSAKIVIGAETGSLVEAACLGVPVIHINTQTRAIHNNPLPAYGKGRIWDCAHNAEEIIVLLSRLISQTQNNPDDTAKLAQDYMKLYFTQPTEEAIVEAFEL